MTIRPSSGVRSRILIAGGGFAAVEAALALRALAGDRVTLTLLSPDPVFHYRPAATSEPFDAIARRAYDLRAIARDLRAEFHQSRLEAVASRRHFARTASGMRLHYDALILATGARPVVGVPGAITFRDQRDIRRITHLLTEIEAGAVSGVVFALPAGPTYPLPLYELALLSARHARERGREVELTLVSPETEPLAPFGTEASDLVRGLLKERGVQFVGAAIAAGVQRDGSLALGDGRTIGAERVVALPELRGRRFTGVPSSQSGFIPVDALGAVADLEHVYAAGDATTFPIKQGGLAAQQADVVAHTIAAGLGLATKQIRAPRVLYARLLEGERAVFVRTEFDWSGQPTHTTMLGSDDEHKAKAEKVIGRYLVPYLETRQPLAEHRRALGESAAARHPVKPTSHAGGSRVDVRKVADLWHTPTK